MAYTTNPYCTASQVYSALDLQASSQTTDGAWIAELISDAQTFIDTELGYSFQTDGTLATPATRLYDGNPDDVRDGSVLFIGTERIISIATVTELTYNTVYAGGVFISGTTTSTDITADCVLQPNNSLNGFWKIKRKSGNIFMPGLQNYQVTGVFGRPSIPADISRACVRMAVHYYKMRDTNYADQVLEQGLVRLKYSKETPNDVLEILDKHKPRVFYV